MNIDAQITISWQPITTRSNGNPITGLLVYQLVATGNGETLEFQTPDSRNSITFIPKNRGFKPGKYDLKIRAVENVGGKDYYGDFAPSIPIGFQTLARPSTVSGLAAVQA